MSASPLISLRKVSIVEFHDSEGERESERVESGKVDDKLSTQHALSAAADGVSRHDLTFNAILCHGSGAGGRSRGGPYQLGLGREEQVAPRGKKSCKIGKPKRFHPKLLLKGKE